MGRRKKQPQIAICKACGAEFEKPATKREDFCSAKCRREWFGGVVLPKRCVGCNKEFFPTSENKTYCPECKANGYKPIIKPKEKSSLPEIVAKARALGLSYGKYVEALEKGLV